MDPENKVINNVRMFAILLHLYYEDTWDEFMLSYLTNLKEYRFHLLINICDNIFDHKRIINQVKSTFPDSIIIETPKLGRDIGGKLALIDLFLSLRLDATYMLILHDKKSLQEIDGNNWRKNLMKIAEPENILHIINYFEKKSTTGLIGVKQFIRNEYSKGEFNTTNDQEIRLLLKKYEVAPSDFSFVAGTMFWVRVKIYRDFFEKFSPLECRKLLERDNVLDISSGSQTHAWERLFSWIVTSCGYKIKAWQ